MIRAQQWHIPQADCKNAEYSALCILACSHAGKWQVHYRKRYQMVCRWCNNQSATEKLHHSSVFLKRLSFTGHTVAFYPDISSFCLSPSAVHAINSKQIHALTFWAPVCTPPQMYSSEKHYWHKIAVLDLTGVSVSLSSYLCFSPSLSHPLSLSHTHTLYTS